MRLNLIAGHVPFFVFHGTQRRTPRLLLDSQPIAVVPSSHTVGYTLVCIFLVHKANRRNEC